MAARLSRMAVPHLHGLLHGLWSDRRLVTAPLWLIPASAGLVLLLGRGVPSNPARFALAQVPLIAAMVAVAHAHHRSQVSLLGWQWRLAGHSDASLRRAMLVPIWLTWFVSVAVQAGTHQTLSWREISAVQAQWPEVFPVLTPGTQTFSTWGGGEARAWAGRVWWVCFALSPVLAGLWAWCLRWLCEWALLSRLRGAGPILKALVIAVALRYGLMRGVSLFQYAAALRLQGSWPETWSLPARIVAGAYAGWCVYPVTLVSLALLFRALAHRCARRLESADQA